MTPKSLAGFIVYNERPESLLAFYRDQLGVPLALAAPGECGSITRLRSTIRISRFCRARRGLRRRSGSLTLTQSSPTRKARGAIQVMSPLDLGEGKRVAGLRGPDGFEIA